MIQWYGERGVINAMVTHLEANGTGPQFLRCIHWAIAPAPAWVGKVTDVSFIVELGLADFGNPDLIMVCKVSDDNLPYCVFVEAKVVPYDASAMPNEPGMAAEGFNSSINGQLALKFRFARSLAAGVGGAAILAEPREVHLGYQVGLRDPKIAPRRLQKRAIIEQVLTSHNLVGLQFDHFAFVALTWDHSPFFNLNGNVLPRFFSEPDHDCYGEMRSRVGWIGYHRLDTVEGLRAAFEPALTLMVGALAPQQIPNEGPQTLTSQPIVNLPGPLQQLTQVLFTMCTDRFGIRCVKLLNGSVSVEPISRVEAKIVPRTEDGQSFVYVGVRPEWPLNDWAGQDVMQRQFNRQLFQFVRLQANEMAATAFEGIIENLREALMQNEHLEE